MERKNVLSPFQRFVKIESFSGFLLLGATLIVIIWANSTFSDSYQAIWNFKIGIISQKFELNKPLILWINDGLMAVFFFLIGLEIKREILIGKLNSLKKVAFPFMGVLGGMLAPVLLYFILNNNVESAQGWGIPMATDIAFSLAILKILGNRVPLSLKLFLTGFAIVDDLGAVLVIALFYSGSIKVELLLIGLIILSILYLISYKGYYSKYVVLFFGIIVWILFLKSGVHPTLAGVLLAFAIPVRLKINTDTFINNLTNITNKIKEDKSATDSILSNEQIAEIDSLESWTNKYQSPLQHLEHKLHDWVAYLVISLFALANAGVAINNEFDLDKGLILNIIICLVIGNGIGVSSIIFLSKKLKIIDMPSDINNRHIIGVSFIAGIGFTMAIFVASLAFADNHVFIASSKIGILIGSLVSALIGFSILRFNRIEAIRQS